MSNETVKNIEETLCETITDITYSRDFSMVHNKGVIETFIGKNGLSNYSVTVNHITATKFDIYIKIIHPNLCNADYRFYNCDNSSILYCLISRLKLYEMYGAPRRNVFANLLCRRK